MLKYENVSIGYTKSPILTDITVTFNQGEITAIVGPNGCGKTTLLQALICGSRLLAGEILLDGRDLSQLSGRERALRLAFLPQTRSIIPALPVRTLVEHGRFPHMGFNRKKTSDDIRLVKEAMDFTGIAPYAEQSVDTLSGGIRQKVFFAMTLAQDTELLVLDEPTTFLDAQASREFFDMLHQLKVKGKTIILVLHDLGQALTHADRIIVMNDKKIAAAGSPEECLQQQILQNVFHTNLHQFQEGGKTYYFFD